MSFIMIAAMLFTGWLSGTVTAMLANTDAMRAAYTEKTESMKLFLKVFIFIQNHHFILLVTNV